MTRSDGSPPSIAALPAYSITSSAHPAGDHVMVLGKVFDGKLLDPEAEPMSYRQTGAMDGASALFPNVFSDSSAS
jgi:hypothetical protein